MTIVFVTELYRYYGGAEYYLLNVIEALEEAGHRVVVLYEEQHEHTVPAQVRPAFRVPGLSRFTFTMHATVRRAVSDILDRVRPDVVYFHYTENWPLLHAVARRWPSLRFVHDATLACYRHWKLLPQSDVWCNRSAGLGCFFAGCTGRPRLKFPEIAAHNRLRRVVVASTAMRDLLVQNGIRPGLISVLPYFVDQPPAAVVPPPAGLPLVLLPGLVHRIKGSDKLLRALALIDEPCTVALVGHMPDPGYAAACRDVVAAAGLAGRVTFTGWLPPEQVRDWYVRASVVVMPSVWFEAFGIVGIEAMAYGRPVVAFAAGGPRDWLRDGETGFLVERGSVAGLAEKISLLLRRPELARQLGCAGQQRFAEAYTRERHLAGLLSVLETVRR